MLRVFFTVALLLFGWAASSSSAVHAANAAAAPTTDATRSPSTERASDDELRDRADQILALIDGTLAPDVDARRLLVLELSNSSLVGRSGERLAALLRGLDEPPVSQESREADLDPASALEAAYLAFLRLPAKRRQELLDAHAERRAATLASDAARELFEQRLAATTADADRLEAFLEGSLDVGVDPRGLIEIDLADAKELGLSRARRETWLSSADSPRAEGETPDPSVETTDAEGDELAEELAAAETRLDALRRRYVRLSPEARASLFEAHRRRIAAAESNPQTESVPEARASLDEEDARSISEAEDAATKAAAERELALETARQAKTEAKRIVAEERARLLGIKEAQARYEASLSRSRVERSTSHEKALEWSRRVGELRSSLMFEREKAALADPMYQEIRSDLAAVRTRLREQLRRMRSAGDDLPLVGEGLDRDLSPDIDRGSIDELRTELVANEAQLRERAQSVDWEVAKAIRDDVVLLNRTRLALLELASPTLRASVTGFGAAGVDQVERELEQISVELGFHALKLLRYRDDLAGRLRGATIPLVFGVAQLVFVVVVFLWWRRLAPDLLSRMHAAARDGRPATRLSSSSATLLWYVQRIRRPLELLLVLWVVFGLIGDLEDFPELVLVWRVALWVLVGTSVILFVDALAARETLFTGHTTDTSKLRIHSLRIVGLNVIAVGMILSLTSAMVGKGAIYSWVLSTCWVLSLPVALYLVHRWRPIIFERLDSRAERDVVTRWVVSKRTGAVSFAAGAAGAAVLLVSGLAAWTMRQLSRLEATRRLLAYLFRREVAKQAAATELDQRFAPVPREVHRELDPEQDLPEPLDVIATAQLQSVAGLAVSTRATLSALIGERGSGKSTFLRRLALQLGSDRVRVVQCTEEGFDALRGELAKLTGDATLRGPALHEGLRGLGLAVIAIDDLQRLVIPAVNGLAALDEFTTFAREVGGELSWVVTIGSASWHYVRRARGDRVFFEQVVRLPRWSEEDLGKLIRSRCRLAGVDPSFEGLVVPRQTDTPLPFEGNRTENGYYRLLWDFSKGNPAVALHAFRESLFMTSAGETVVRLFKQPSSEEIEDLPLSVLFILRTIAQLELALPVHLQSATQLPPVDVDDALRFCLSRGYIEPFHGGVRLAWPWYRTITTVLVRQHLLPSL